MATFPLVKNVDEWILGTLTKEDLAIDSRMILFLHSCPKSSSSLEDISTNKYPESNVPDIYGKWTYSPFLMCAFPDNSHPDSLSASSSFGGGGSATSSLP